MSIVYSTQRGGFLPGFTYRNPRYFQRPMAEGARVIVIGDWPAVVKAYAGIGVGVVAVATTQDLAGLMRAEDGEAAEYEPAADNDPRHALRAEYEALTGEAPDKRWGEKRLRDEIDGARGDA